MLHRAATKVYALGLLLGVVAGWGCLRPPPPVASEPASAVETPKAQPAAPSAPQPAAADPVRPSPARVEGRTKLALLSSGVWIDDERLGSLDVFDALGLLERLRARRAQARAGVDATNFELEVDTAASAEHIQSTFGLAAHAGYERAHWVTSSGDLTLCASDCARGANEANRKLRTLVVIAQQGMTLWSGREVPDGPPPVSADLVKRAEAPWTVSSAELEASLTRACVESRACSHMLIYLSDPDGGQLGRALELLDRVGRNTSESGSAAPVLEFRLYEPPEPAELARAFVAKAASGSGSLRPVLIRQIVRASYGSFRHCYEQGLARNTELRGRVTVRFVIGADGSVSDVSNGGSDFPDEAVVTCVIDVFKTIRFPPPDGGIVTVQYPIMLQPRD